jgi:hypothetical protein
MKPPAVPEADFAVHASVYGELFPHSGSAAAGSSLDAPVSPLRSAYLAQPIAPFFPEFSS